MHLRCIPLACIRSWSLCFLQSREFHCIDASVSLSDTHQLKGFKCALKNKSHCTKSEWSGGLCISAVCSLAFCLAGPGTVGTLSLLLTLFPAPSQATASSFPTIWGKRVRFHHRTVAEGGGGEDWVLLGRSNVHSTGVRGCLS